MRLNRAAPIEAQITREFCASISQESPLYVSHRPLANKPPRECLVIVPEHIESHGGEQLNGWAIWEVPGVFIEAEFHAVWRDGAGELHDLTPRPEWPGGNLTFLPDPKRMYRGRQIDNIRKPLVKDRDVIRFLFLNHRVFEIMNAGDLADQHGLITLPPKAAREIGQIQKEMEMLWRRLDRRYP
ncbi:zinc chelation protein SecC [Burkholderia anthina]|uniref:zinc chelation protein SecC n=1 Tax=Burkholderia anthina TaxID=179879 RepID=UPI00158C52EE|nr:zinc chelation protein SecC [Burkholderia anthina]